MNKKILLFACTALLFSSACDDDGPAPPQSSDVRRVIISNEGQFNTSNASISIYYPEGDSVQNDVYSQVNGFELGDILQSIAILDGELMAVLNNSGKVESMDRSDLTANGFIDGMTSPRYLLSINEEKSYVSDLFGDISIIDPEAQVMIGTIPTDGVTTGQMLLHGTEAYVCFEGSNAVTVFDTETDSEVHSFEIARTPIDVLKDADGMIWMLFTGAYYEPVTDDLIQEQPHLVRVDPESKEVMTDITFNDWDGVQDMSLSPDGRSIILLKATELFSIEIEGTTISPLPGFDVDGNIYGRIGVDPDNGDIYLTNAGNFIDPGTIQRYSAGGTLLREFGVGVNPNGVVFD